MSERRTRRRRQRSPRGCSSPSFILVAVDASLPSLPPARPKFQVATLASSTWKSQTVVYDCLKRQGRNATQDRLTYCATIARGDLSPLPWYLICTSTQQPQQRGPALALLLTRTGVFGWFRPNWSSASSVSLCHHAAHRHCYPLGGCFWLCLCRWFQQRVSGAFRGGCDSLLFLCRRRLCS